MVGVCGGAASIPVSESRPDYPAIGFSARCHIRIALRQSRALIEFPVPILAFIASLRAGSTASWLATFGFRFTFNAPAGASPSFTAFLSLRYRVLRRPPASSTPRIRTSGRVEREDGCTVYSGGGSNSNRTACVFAVMGPRQVTSRELSFSKCRLKSSLQMAIGEQPDSLELEPDQEAGKRYRTW